MKRLNYRQDSNVGGSVKWGAILSAEGVGGLLGGIVMLRVHPRRPLLVATLATLVYPVPLFFIAARTSVVVIALSGFVAGVFIAVFNVQWTTTLQREIPERILSRVSAYDWIGSLVVLPLGMALAGPVASKIGVTSTLVGCGAIIYVVILLTLLVPSVVRLTAPVRHGEFTRDSEQPLNT